MPLLGASFPIPCHHTTDPKAFADRETKATVDLSPGMDVDDFANAGLFRLQLWADDGTFTLASEVFQYAVESVTTVPTFA